MGAFEPQGVRVNERFIRCSLCGYPHHADEEFCPITRRPIRKSVSHQPALNPTPRQAKEAPAPPEPHSAPRSAPPRIPQPIPQAIPRLAVPRPERHVPLVSPTPTPSVIVQDELIGQTIGGKYEVRSQLGSGGMGSVFEAVHLGIGRRCAVKILNANQLQKKDAVRRFHHEARAAARIGHPNICEVYDFGTLEDGRPYLVMEKLVGETWADLIAREGGLPFADVIDVMRQVLSGLYAAHENGIIHRDIKPENVFLSKRVGCPPVAKLLDFGVSKMMTHHPQSKDDGDLEMTRTGIVLGTPYYLAPEQARGDRNLDARVDLYACGVMLYEALTGKRPFVAANYNALLIQILTGAPRPIRELRKDIPPDLAAIVEKSMSRERHQRYQSAVDFQADLQQAELAAPSRAPSNPKPPPRVQPEPAFVPPRAPPAERPVSTRQGGYLAQPPAEIARQDLESVSRGRDQLIQALPVSRDETRPQRRQSSSAEIDALIGMNPLPEKEPLKRTPQRGTRARTKGGHGFDDQPTEVQLDRLRFDDESTARAVSQPAVTSRPGGQEAGSPDMSGRKGGAQRLGQTTGRQRALLEKKHLDFADDSKTDVMSPDLSSRIRESEGSGKHRPHPPGPGRPRRG
jgi:eukaryotic-like serine/threonine-protein kinase